MGSSESDQPDDGSEVVRRIASLLREAQRSDDVDATAETLIRDLKDVVKAARATLFALDLNTGLYERWSGDKSGHDRFEARRQLSGKQPSSDLRLRAVYENKHQEQRADATLRIVYPVLRGNVAIAVIDLEIGIDPSLDTNYHTAFQPYLMLVTILLERRFLLNLIRTFPHSIDLGQQEEEYLGEVSLFLHQISSMQYVALRELSADREELRPLSVWGFEDNSADRFRITRADAWAQPFWHAIDEEEVQVVSSVADRGLRDLRGMAPGVESFVAVPVFVGTEIFGLLSVAASCEYEYTDIEVGSFELVANAIGSAISNYRSSREAFDRYAHFRDYAKTLTANELAQAARHEIGGALESVQLKLALAQPKKDPSRAEEILDDVSDLLVRIGTAVDNLRRAQAMPVRNSKFDDVVSLKSTFMAAREYSVGKLDNAKIRCTFEGTDVRVRCSEDWLRTVFINLILNSIDAYSSGSRPQRGRWIRLTIHPFSPNDRRLVMTFQDEAGGINPASLVRNNAQTVDKPLEQLIFEAGVTSKPAGTGAGLHLARRVMSDHQGNIELASYRRGTSFSLSLPASRINPDSEG